MVSVIVCTYNRSELLMQTLCCLQRQITNVQYEIIIVDNNSTDGTELMVNKFISSTKCSVIYSKELNQGLSYARNAGINIAKGDLVVFTDDDVEIDVKWLDRLIKCFEDNTVFAAGGPVRPIWPNNMSKPAWLSADFISLLSINEFPETKKRGFFSYPEFPCGVNMAFRRQLFESVGLFPVSLGRIGNSLLSGEEVCLFNLIESKGYKIAFAGDAIINHKIDENRLKKKWFYRRLFFEGMSSYIIDTLTMKYSDIKLYEKIDIMLSNYKKMRQNCFNSKCWWRYGLGYLVAFIDRNKSENIFRMICKFSHHFSNNSSNQLLTAMVNSWSWKITKPFRTIGASFGNIGAKQ